MFRRQLKRFRTRHRWRRDLTSHARSAIEERSGTVGNDNELARQRLLSSRGVSVPTCHRTQVSQSFGELQVSQFGTPSQEDKLTNTLASGDKTTGDAPTARTRVGALPHSHPGLCGTLVGPGKDTHGTPVLLRREGRGWPETRSTRHHHNDETKVVTPRLGYQHTSRIVMGKKLRQNLDGESIRLECMFVHRKQGLFLVSFCGWHQNGWKEAECGSHVEEIEEKCGHRRTHIIS